jgi:hypothetical protein
MTGEPSRPNSTRSLWLGLSGVGLAAIVGVCLVSILAVSAIVYYLRQPAAPEPTVAYLLDTSHRMSLPAAGSQGQTRLELAQAVLAEVIRPAEPSLRSGMRVFGSGAKPESCKDTDLIVPFGSSNRTQIADTLLSLSPGPSTDAALAEAIVAAIRDLSATRGPHTLVVVTGGADSCNTQAGQLIRQEAERAGIPMQQFIIGFMVDAQDAQAIKVMIEEGGRGQYLAAPDSDTLKNILLAIQYYLSHPTNVALQWVQTAATPGAVLNLPTQAGPTPDRTDGYPSQTACDHPYFPVRPGASWTYSLSSGRSYTWRVTGVSGDLRSATASVLYTYDDTDIGTYDWACTSEGITYFPLAAFVGGFFLLDDYDIRMTHQSGASILTAGQLASGATWDGAYTVDYWLGQACDTFSVSISASETYTAGALQSLSHPLGVFEVIPVTTNGTSTVMGHCETEQTNRYTSITSYAKGIGIIRREITSECDNDCSIQLTSFSAP